MKHKLGKTKPRIDAKTPCLSKFMGHMALKNYPTKQDWITPSKIRAWGMMLNDQLGCCVISDKGHSILLWTTLAGAHHQVMIPDSAILAGYEAVGGYVPGQPNTDQGCDMLTASQYFVSTGFGGHRISAYAAIPNNLSLTMGSINAFGSVSQGIAIPTAWENLENPDNVWDVDPKGTTTGDWAPGSLGGHNVPLMGYDSAHDMFSFITWGQRQYITGRALTVYGDEQYAYLSPDWVAAGLAPNKFNLAQLQQDLALETHKAMPKINFAGVLAFIQQMVALLGPVAVPMIENYVKDLPLTPAQIALIDTVLNAALTAFATKVA